MANDLISTATASKILGCTQIHAARLARDNHIYAEKSGRGWMLSREEVLQHRDRLAALNKVTARFQAQSVSARVKAHLAERHLAYSALRAQMDKTGRCPDGCPGMDLDYDCLRGDETPCLLMNASAFYAFQNGTQQATDRT